MFLEMRDITKSFPGVLANVIALGAILAAEARDRRRAAA